MISFESQGDWARTFRFLKKASDMKIMSILEKYARLGADALSSDTPKRTGLTAASWHTEIEKTGTGWTIHFLNSNTNKGVNIAYIIQMGHGTGTGGYVEGIDYINPALQPIMKGLAEEAFKEVSSI